MATFKRGLCEAFVDALNEEYKRKEAGWWSQFVDDKDLFLAIRDDQVHVYYQGCRLINVEWTGKLAAKTHYKYLLRPAMTPEYVDVDVVDGQPCVDASGYFADGLNVEDLKKAATVYAGDEKEGVHKILRHNPHILDVEVAISDGKTAPRVDFAALQKGDAGRTHLVFYEAKHFDKSRGALRSRDGTASVVDQIAEYRELLKRYRHDIEKSYRLVSKNLRALKGVRRHHPKRHDLLEMSEDLVIEVEPGLVVFGFDQEQKSGSVWQHHEAKLERDITGELVLRGKPEDVRIPEQYPT